MSIHEFRAARLSFLGTGISLAALIVAFLIQSPTLMTPSVFVMLAAIMGVVTWLTGHGASPLMRFAALLPLRILTRVFFGRNAFRPLPQLT